MSDADSDRAESADGEDGEDGRSRFGRAGEFALDLVELVLDLF